MKKIISFLKQKIKKILSFEHKGEVLSVKKGISVFGPFVTVLGLQLFINIWLYGSIIELLIAAVLYQGILFVILQIILVLSDRLSLIIKNYNLKLLSIFGMLLISLVLKWYFWTTILLLNFLISYFKLKKDSNFIDFKTTEHHMRVDFYGLWSYYQYTILCLYFNGFTFLYVMQENSMSEDLKTFLQYNFLTHISIFITISCLRIYIIVFLNPKNLSKGLSVCFECIKIGIFIKCGDVLLDTSTKSLVSDAPAGLQKYQIWKRGFYTVTAFENLAANRFQEEFPFAKIPTYEDGRINVSEINKKLGGSFINSTIDYASNKSIFTRDSWWKK